MGGAAFRTWRMASTSTIDDLAKLTTLLQHGGQHQGQQLLSAAKLAEALYKTEAMGLPSGEKNRFGEGTLSPVVLVSALSHRAPGASSRSPIWSGRGQSRHAPAQRHLDLPDRRWVRLRPGQRWCWRGRPSDPSPVRRGLRSTPPPVRQPLTASALRAEMPGHTFYRDPVNIFPASLAGAAPCLWRPTACCTARSHGSLTARTDDVGRWRITPEGQFCRTWHVWDGRRERCFAVYREGESFELAVQDRFGKEVYRRLPGNPEGY